MVRRFLNRENETRWFTAAYPQRSSHTWSPRKAYPARIFTFCTTLTYNFEQFLFRPQLRRAVGSLATPDFASGDRRRSALSQPPAIGLILMSCSHRRRHGCRRYASCDRNTVGIMSCGYSIAKDTTGRSNACAGQSIGWYARNSPSQNCSAALLADRGRTI